MAATMASASASAFTVSTAPAVLAGALRQKTDHIDDDIGLEVADRAAEGPDLLLRLEGFVRKGRVACAKDAVIAELPFSNGRSSGAEAFLARHSRIDQEMC